MNPKLLARYLFRESLGIFMMGTALFWPAGRWDWPAAWAALALMAAWSAATTLIILRNPGLLAERLGPRRGSKGWDTLIMSALGLIQLARYILAGFDRRLGWTVGISPLAQWAALACSTLGIGLVVWATASNRFFSQVVRIQTERGHTVVTGGPYRFVRHPSYAGVILFELTVPVLLASWPAWIVSLANVALIILRTALEDRTLHSELPGYAKYAAKVRCRLLPGIW